MRKKLITALATIIGVGIPSLAWAADGSAIDSGDTGFILMCAALVLLMTPGLAFFYGGMVRKKNVLSTLMHSFFIIALISIQWVLFGYTLAFGPDLGHLVGGLDSLGLNGVGIEPLVDYAATIPGYAFVSFQLMFAIITPALISGSFAERMKFPAFALFTLLWATFIYDPLAHWVWGVDGWLRNLGALDFAGGTVVHISSGVSGLVAAIVLGKRKGYGTHPMIPHQLPMTLLGAGLLWFGWFGFNAGSALGANGLAATAFITTNTAAAAAALSWIFVEWVQHGKPTALGAASGLVAGLVSITPAAGFVSPLSAIAIGLVGGVVCYLGVGMLKAKLGYDDALDAFGCHGIGGTWGAIATGIFASKAVNELGADGILMGNFDLVKAQIIGVVATYLFAGIGTFVILKLVGLVCELRVSAEDEEMGLDITQHGEDAYPEYSIGSTLVKASTLTSDEKIHSPVIQS